MSYKSLLIEALADRGSAGAFAYRRVKRLNDVFNDPEFRADNGQFDDFGLAGILDQYVEDLCLRFLELREMFKRYPDESQWAEGRLRTMYDQLCKEVDESRKSDRSPSKPREKADPGDKYNFTTIAQAKDVLESTELKLESIQARYKKLSKDYKELVAENNSLRARIEELERLIATDRQMAVA